MADNWTVVGTTPAAKPSEQWKVVGQKPAEKPESFSTGDPALDAMGGAVMEQARSGLYQMGHGVSQILQQDPSTIPGVESYPSAIARTGARVGEGALNFVGGAAKYLGSPLAPLMAPRQEAYHRLVGAPVEQATGSPFLGQIAEGTVGNIAEMGAMGGFRAPAPIKSLPIEATGLRPTVKEGARQGMLRGAQPEALAPSTEALRRTSDEAYDAIRASDVIVKPEAVNRLARDVRSYLAGQGYTPKLQTGVGALLDELDSTIQNGNVTYQGLVNLRRIAQNVGKGNPPHGQGHMAGKIVDQIDGFLETLKDNPHEIVSGNPAEAIATLRTANSAYSRLRKVEDLNKAIEKGLENAGPHVGNVEGMVATQLKLLLRNQKTARQFSPVEREAIRRIVHGDNLQNVLRFVGKFSPENVIPAMAESLAAAGWAFTNPVAAGGAVATAGAGFLARRAAGARTNAKINALSEQLRRGPTPPDRSLPPNAQPPQGGPQGPIIPPPHQLPPRPQSPMSGTMYSNPLDPAAFKALFGRRGPKPPDRSLPPNAQPPIPRGQTAADFIRSQEQSQQPLTLGPENEVQTAYHGTPHDFDAFDMSKIGTGEGAQAYGHGLYFAENEGVARSYKENLSGNASRDIIVNEPEGARVLPKPPGVGVAPHGMTPEQLATKQIGITGNVAGAHRQLEFWGSRLAAAAKDQLGRAQTIGRSYPRQRAEALASAEATAKNAQRHHEAAQWLRENGSKIALGPEKTGRVYQVAIKARPEEFLDWDKPLHEQSPQVQDVLRKLGVPKSDFTPEADLGVFMGNKVSGAPVTGGEAYNTRIRKQLNAGPFNVKTVTAPEAAEALRKAGIKGIRYLDRDSRVGQGGTSNYVIFDDKIISVLKKYAIPMTVTATGAIIVASANLPPDVKRQLDGT